MTADRESERKRENREEEYEEFVETRGGGRGSVYEMTRRGMHGIGPAQQALFACLCMKLFI